LRHLPLQGCFDRILMIRVLEYVPEKLPLFWQLSQILAANGRLLIVTKGRSNVHGLKRKMLRRARRSDSLGRCAAPDIWRLDPWEVAALAERVGLRVRGIWPVVSRLIPAPLTHMVRRCAERLPACVVRILLFLSESYLVVLERS